MKAHPENIERLLNGYIDGELTVRQQTEVKRLLNNDPKVAARLRQLQKCKMLLSSLPTAQAPAEMLDDVIARLARRSLLGEQPAAANERAGVRDLFFRQVVTAAAMIALLGVLAVVVYTIVAPPRVVGPDLVTPPAVIEAPRIAFAKFNGRLELTTADFRGMDAAVNRAVEENGLVECRRIERLGERTIYVLTCGREGLNRLLQRLGKDWSQLDSATIFVETDLFNRPVAVTAVTPDQIAEIAAQTTSQDTVRIASDLAMLNSLTERIRSSAVLVAEDRTPDFTVLPMPRLTKKTATAERAVVDKPNVDLVIVLTRSN